MNRTKLLGTGLLFVIAFAVSTVTAFAQGAGGAGEPVVFDLPLVAALSAFLIAPVKFFVDVIRGVATSLPGAYVPLIGVAIGVVLAAVVLVAVETPFTASVVAQCGIAAVFAQAGAMAISGGQNRANERKAEAGIA